MKRRLAMIGISLIVAMILIMGNRFVQKEQTVVINEVRSWDASDSRGGYFGSDYIELYNTTDEAISLHGWYVSDDAEDTKRCQLHDLVIDAKDYLLLYADGNDELPDSLNFKINPDGEKILLSDAQGNPVDSIYVPKQKFGTVYARATDGAKEWCAKEESIGFSNDDAKNAPTKTLEEPVFSHESGFYEDSFLLTMKAGTDQEIYYTMDGSEPDENSNRYLADILIENVSKNPNVANAVRNVVVDWEDYYPDSKPVDKAVVVRAVAKDKDGNFSEVVTNTYFVGLPKYKDQNVISIVADHEDLFGDEGIFVTGKAYEEGNTEIENFLQGGRAWEVKANFQLFENGTQVSNQSAGIRVQGASTRKAAKKKMSIYSREEYSDNAYFEGITLGGNQIHSVYTNHSTSSAFLPELLSDRSLAIQHSIPCEVFLNGEYWYSTYILDKYNQYYVADTFGVARDNVVIVKDDGVTAGPEDKFASYQMVRGLSGMLELSNPEEYAQFKEELEIQSYIDYIATNVYLCNMDMAEWKNSMLWRTIEDDGTEYGDTRWRWMLFDIDCVEWADPGFYGVSERAEINSFTEVMQFTGSAIADHYIYSACKNSPEFCKQFVLSFLDIANVNLAFENVEELYETKIGGFVGNLEEFFKNRFDYIVPYMAEEFNLSGTLEEVTLKVNDSAGGTIKLNTTTPDISDGSWSGRYYTDYPVTVTAIPADGYEFAGWSGSVVSDDAIIEAEVLEGGIVLEAVFEKVAD